MTLVLLLEELSARDLLEGLLPKLIPGDVAIRYLVFEGKQDLEKQLPRKIRSWLMPDSLFVVMRDQDSMDCAEAKRRLVERVAESGRDGVLVRVACKEIESWVLGDWHAVAQAFEMPQLANQALKAIYREPDQLSNPVSELRKFIPEYQKRDGARRIGPFLDPNSNNSRSFRAFCAGVRSLIAGQRAETAPAKAE